MVYAHVFVNVIHCTCIYIYTRTNVLVYGIYAHVPKTTLYDDF